MKSGIQLVKSNINHIGLLGTMSRAIDLLSQKLSYDYITYTYLEKKYSNSIYGSYKDNFASKKIDSNYRAKIFVCWLQGIENAPDVVKSSYNNLLEKEKDKEIILITEKNLNKWVNLPDYIVEKHKKGIISFPHYSDLIRLNLLINHGGIWIDSTMFLTEKIPKEILDSELFVFKLPYGNRSRQLASNQFIVSAPRNEILIRTYNGLLAFWEKENKPLHYSIFHYIFSLAVKSNTDTINLWESIPHYSSGSNHILQSELFNKFNKNRYEYLKKITFIHKLTYKNLSKQNLDKKDTYYEHIIRIRLSKDSCN